MTAVIPQARVPYAPDMQVIREVTGSDVSLPTKREAGINCADFDELMVFVTPKTGGTAATVEPHFWSSPMDLVFRVAAVDAPTVAPVRLSSRDADGPILLNRRLSKGPEPWTCPPAPSPAQRRRRCFSMDNRELVLDSIASVKVGIYHFHGRTA